MYIYIYIYIYIYMYICVYIYSKKGEHKKIINILRTSFQ